YVLLIARNAVGVPLVAEKVVVLIFGPTIVARLGVRLLLHVVGGHGGMTNAAAPRRQFEIELQRLLFRIARRIARRECHIARLPPQVALDERPRGYLAHAHPAAELSLPFLAVEQLLAVATHFHLALAELTLGVELDFE